MVEKESDFTGPSRAPLLTIFGAGYLAGFVGVAALKRGWRVAGLTRNPDRAEELRQAGWEQVIVADLADRDWWPEFADRPDYVVNMVSSGGGGLEGYEKSYIGGMQSILGWAAGHPHRDEFEKTTILYTSSTGVYPDVGGGWVTEADAEAGGEGRPGILLRAEALVREGASSLFGRWFILRLAGLYGPGRSFLVRQLREGGGRLAGRGDHFLNLVRVEDAADAVLAALESGAQLRNRIWNVADGNPAHKAEIVSWLGEQMGLDRPRFSDSESGTSWRGGKNRRINTESISRELGWQPRFADFREGFGGLLT